jgi:hypothetical protein
VFTVNTLKHLQDTSHRVTGDILVGLSEGVQQGLHLHLDLVQHVPDSTTFIWELLALLTNLTNGLFHLLVETMQFHVKLLAKLLILLVFSLLQIIFFLFVVL